MKDQARLSRSIVVTNILYILFLVYDKNESLVRGHLGSFAQLKFYFVARGLLYEAYFFIFSFDIVRDLVCATHQARPMIYLFDLTSFYSWQKAARAHTHLCCVRGRACSNVNK